MNRPGKKQVHTLKYPYCSNPTCWCHTESYYHRLVVQRTVSEAKQTQELRRFVASRLAS
jgi:hypothetical protein